MKPLRLLLVAVLALAGMGLVPSAATAVTDPIQPGDFMETSTGSCTLNFVYAGQGGKAGSGVYLGTAAHCVGDVGQDVSTIDGEVFGDVAFIGDPEETATDFALVEVRPAFLSRVSPAMKGSPQFPTGVTTPEETEAGDLLQLSGYGVGFDLLPVTQEERVAVLVDDDAETWQAVGPLTYGDSGGPLVHIPTGKALGSEMGLCLGVCTDEGPTVQGILAKARADGFPVTLRTV